MIGLDILDTSLKGLKVIQRNLQGDHRGYLERMYCVEEMGHLIPERGIVQINHTMTTKRGTVRGMHFQYPPFAETKIVSCLRGEVFDVAVDLRRGSATFLQWHAEIVSAANHKTLLIPEGFAHGFQTLTECCELIYFHTAAYQPAAEGGLNSQDPRLDIRWPLAVEEMSLRDAAHPLLSEGFEGVML
jgi:dTDP-4-dehydrorhamnose 3,5-epimerase